MKKIDVVKQILGERYGLPPRNECADAFAPTNIALCKYWGKRDQELNLPQTSSLSISLGDKGAHVVLRCAEKDAVLLNGHTVSEESAFYKKLLNYINLFRSPTLNLEITISSNIPIAAGLASSACGFASTIKGIDKLFGWELDATSLSILARLGSGSASRSIWHGFVEWHAGMQEDGMDSFGIPLAETWPELCIGLVILNEKEKTISSREAMQRTVSSSALYTAWPSKVSHDLSQIKRAIHEHDFALLGKTAESNATTMHATMLGAWPAINYALPETLLTMQKVWELRQEGLPLYFTQDAGPNVKLLFEKEHENDVRHHFPEAQLLQPFF